MNFKFFSITFFVSLLVLTSCSDGDDSDSTSGKLTVQLTDAPFPHDLVAEANVTIFKMEARNKNENTEPEGDVSPFVVLMEEEIDVNLLDLTNGVTETLVNTEIPVGTYDLVRVYVKGINIVLTDGTTYDLKVPSGDRTGIKVFIKPGLAVSGGLSADLLLDFDVSRSFVPKGEAKDLTDITGFNFKPVIKASNLSMAGALYGTVTTLQEEVSVGLEGAQISIFASDTLNTSTFSDASGAYMVMGLETGTYKVLAELEGFISSDTINAEIVAANKTILGFELEPETEEQGN